MGRCGSVDLQGLLLPHIASTAASLQGLGLCESPGLLQTLQGGCGNLETHVGSAACGDGDTQKEGCKTSQDSEQAAVEQ